MWHSVGKRWLHFFVADRKKSAQKTGGTKICPKHFSGENLTLDPITWTQLYLKHSYKNYNCPNNVKYNANSCIFLVLYQEMKISE